jgi:hypothetical protein
MFLVSFWYFNVLQVVELHLGLIPSTLRLKIVRGALATKIESSDDSHRTTPTKMAISKVVELQLG